MSGFSERSIQDMLGEKHAKDVFVRACKSGPSWTGERVRILDGWAMPRSWARPQCVGYEIKLSRSDWLGDKKWPSYLELCHQLYIVCPHGLLKKSEIPDPLGLVYACAGEGRRLITAKKAAVRDVQIPESLFRYVLMNRCQITNHDIPDGTPDLRIWREWLEGREDTRSLGRQCSKKVARLFDAEIKKDVKRTAEHQLESLQKRLADIQRVLHECGVPMYRASESEIAELKRRLTGNVAPAQVRRSLAAAKRSEQSIRQLIEELQELEDANGETGDRDTADGGVHWSAGSF